MIGFFFNVTLTIHRLGLIDLVFVGMIQAFESFTDSPGHCGGAPSPRAPPEPAAAVTHQPTRRAPNYQSRRLRPGQHRDNNVDFFGFNLWTKERKTVEATSLQPLNFSQMVIFFRLDAVIKSVDQKMNGGKNITFHI